MATYLITQATGQQSQWVIRHLLAAGCKVHAVVRDLQKELPPTLHSPGVTLFQGESKNSEEIFKAAQGCKGAFLNTFPIPGLEAQQAQAIVEACKKAGVETIVAATTQGTSDKAMWNDAETKECGMLEYYLSKAAVEDIVRRADFRAYTILRPAFIHFDYLLPNAWYNYPRLPSHGELDHACNENARIPQTDGHDIGKYASAALLDPAKFGGQEIDMGNETPNIEEIRAVLAKVSGRDVRARKRTPEEEEEAKTSLWAQRFHLFANVKDFGIIPGHAKEVQTKFGIPFTSLENALQRDKAALLECLPAN
ncbi:hypothetical protein BKA67DRAFT_569023 [Truncatella angustata]|uniref:NmrA-like domain-containing protein n=1 Tax=Truncatella angustata TaxID=152316 RepID=A0A9P8UJD0_9PEZI|nr:uncharacterized protein BKA67DRAFT_569023 [Truncatella angustata]KAH6653262.1 hypothetical protein BKA67DRAFT_569023 [Truncatella angustata]KAH8193794.1 hypothetical protein TruAng_012038 [Truncatella angustata]